jgi:serine/threonine protein phosphatase PrpC
LIVATSTNSNAEILNDVKEDSFSNVTYSAGSNFHFEQWKYSILDANEYNSVLLCTDGISDDLISGSEYDFAKGLYEAYGNCKPRKRYYEILHWLKNWPTPKHTDDKTIACLNKVSNNG